MKMNGVASLMRALFLLSLLTTNLVSSAPTLADHPLQTHLLEWRTLPTGERVSYPEKMHRHHKETWKRTTAEASVQQWRENHDAIAWGSRGRKLYNSRSLVAANTTTEVNALLAFRSAVQTDPTGALANWTLENEATRCTTWKGVTCDESGQVTGIELPSLGLNGTISPTIGDLAHLSSVNLTGSSLWGQIPSALGRCQNLSVLDLSNNTLAGEVPAELFTLTKLEFLWLWNNNLSGRLPEVVETNGCQSMSSLWVDNNEISGTLPSSLSRCQNLTLFSFTNNRLNGSIPASLGELHQLQALWLDSNSFTGHIPSQLGSLTKLQVLTLEANNLDGLIPPFIGTFSELQYLDLKNNKLTGPIPPSLGNCSSLVNLMLGYNKLAGTIPEELGNLSSILQFGFEYNGNLTGPVPGFLSKCSKLKILFLGACGFTSIAPAIWSMKNLEHFIIFSNKLTGELPLEVGNCTSLSWLDLGWYPNRLTGSIPPTLGLLKNLTKLSLMMNLFTGGIPKELGNLEQLEMLWLSQNHLTGNIPVGLGNLAKLQELDLSQNGLNGAIPDDLGGCVFLNLFDLSSNYFTGGIPKFLGNFSDLTSLDLSSNTLNDDAVALSSLSQCPNLETLMIGQNNIYGSLPVDFTKWPGLKYFSVTGNMLTGGIPPSFGSINSSLVLVDFSRNKFTGGFPAQVDGTHLSCLRVLLFSHNEIDGSIPSWFGNLKSLQVLDLSFNKLTGSIPQNFGNLDGYKVQSNDNTGSPDAAFTLKQGLSLTFGGDSVSFSYFLQATTLMDLSSNALQGEIPLGIMDLVGLKYLILSNNSFEGNIWTAVQNLKALETLDLSQNNLSGPLPPALPSFLSKFNVSLNNLSGAIPTGGQYDTFPNSYYLPGNSGLCGDVIQRPCTSDNLDSLHNEVIVSDYISFPGFGIGAVVGFCIVVMTALLWARACVYVFGAVKATTRIQLGYGLFNPKI